MIKASSKSIQKPLKKLHILPIVLTTILITLLLLTYEVVMLDKFFPQTFIGDSNISFLTKAQAYQTLNNKFNQRAKDSLQFFMQKNTYSIDLPSTSPNLDISTALDETFNNSHQGTILNQLRNQLSTLFLKSTFTPNLVMNLEPQIEKLAKDIDLPATDAAVWLDNQNQIHIKEGFTGMYLDKEKLREEARNYLLLGHYSNSLPVKNIDPNFTTEAATKAQKALENISQTPLKLTFGQDTWTIDLPILFHLLNTSDSSGLLDQTRLTNFISDIATKINHPVEEPLFKFDSSSKRVAAFRPAVDGTKLDEDQTTSLILAALTTQKNEPIALPVSVVKPNIKTDEINNLGIKELIGKGVSNFAGSIPNRIYNVGLTASKINGVLIPPGSIFSFNNTVGDISAATGFKQAYVIKGGRTVLDDGGGVCQDSTTLFRAVLNAGLPIISRTAHAYRVGYYEQGFPPGLDATVFYPTVDFKFKNDTPGYILIQAYIEGLTLNIDLYGTSDGRLSQLSKPVISEQTPAPPDLRQDDPTLQKGTVKQVDWAAWGAKVAFSRTVTRNGETIASEIWRSNYKPWQAVYLIGTKE